MKRIDSPLTIFLIGVTGDLSRKKILPAIYRLYKDKTLPHEFQLIGVARKDFSKQQFEDYICKILQPPRQDDQWREFCSRFHYVSGDVSDPATFHRLKEFHKSQDNCGNHLWYVATLPSLYLAVIKNIRVMDLEATECGWTKFLLEKPFGTSLNSSQKLNDELLQVFREDQIYRIDHFLAKETIQNLMVFRFGNGIFEHLWNNHYIDNIQVTASETIGVAGRYDFYDQTNVVRDVVQNHVLQILAMSLMEEPSQLAPQAIHRRRMEFLSQLENISPLDIVERVAFGQYSSGKVDGKPVPGYQQEDSSLASSQTPTAMAAKLFVHSPRWEGVPIYLRAGKRLAQEVIEINFQFKEPKNRMFIENGHPQQPNILTIRLKPNEGVVLRMNVKQPGLTLEMKEVPMQFCYKSEFQMGLIEAYEKLIYDAVQGDPTLFPQAQDIDASWQSVQPLLDYLEAEHIEPDAYQAGSWGPASFQKIIDRDNRHWIQPSPDICNL